MRTSVPRICIMHICVTAERIVKRKFTENDLEIQSYSGQRGEIYIMRKRRKFYDF